MHKWLSIALLCSGAAHAQTTTEKTVAGTGVSPAAFEKFDFALVVGLNPSIGKALPLDAGDKALEESEYSVTLKGERALDAFTVKTLFGAAVSPNMRDASKDSSKLFAQVGLETKDTLTAAMRSGKLIKGQDVLIGYLRYRVEQPYSEFFDDNSALTHRVSLGVDYKNYLAVWCDTGERRETTGCSGGGSVGFVISPSIARVFSSDRLKEKLAPKLVGEFLFPTRRGIDFVVAAEGELSRFTAPAAGAAVDRRDETVKIKIGVDPSRYLRQSRLKLPDAFAIGIAVQWRKNWSNAADQRYERVYVMPSLAITF